MKLLLLTTLFAATWALPVSNDVQAVLDEEKVTDVFRKPAMKMRLTKKGFDMLNTKAMTAFNKTMSHQTFDELKVNNDKSCMMMTNMTTTDFAMPKFTYAMISKTSTIVWQGLGGKTEMAGMWEMNMENATATSDKHQEVGTFTMTMKGFNMTTTMSMGMKRGKPTMTMDACTLNMDAMHFDFNCTEKARELLPTDNYMTKFWKDNMRTSMCQMVMYGLVDVDAVLQSFKTEIPMTTPFKIDYTMLSKPTVQPTFCESMHMAEISTTTMPTAGTHLLPTPMPSLDSLDDTTMMAFQFSDYMFNSFCDAMFREGMLNVTVTNETVAPEMAVMLETHCESGQTCVGSISEEMSTKYPNATVHLRIQAIKPMFVETKPTGMTVQTHSTITMTTCEGVEIMTMAVSGRAMLTPEIMGNSMTMNATLMHMKVTITKTILEKVDIEMVEKLTEMGLLTDKPFFTQILERYMTEGIPLPRMVAVSMTEPRIVYQDRAMAVMFDLNV